MSFRLLLGKAGGAGEMLALVGVSLRTALVLGGAWGETRFQGGEGTVGGGLPADGVHADEEVGRRRSRRERLRTPEYGLGSSVARNVVGPRRAGLITWFGPS